MSMTVPTQIPLNLEGPIFARPKESTPQTPATTAPQDQSPQTQETQQAPASQQAPAQIGQGDNSQVQTLRASAHEPTQVDFGIGASLGAALGGLGAIFAGAPSKSIEKISTRADQSGLADNSLEKSVHRTMSEREAEQKQIDTSMSSGQTAPTPEGAVSQAPAATAVQTPAQSARPDERAEQEEQPQ